MTAVKKSFTSRVVDSVIQCAKQYEAIYVDRSYLIFSDAFINNPFYEIEAHKDNYLHLTGITTQLSARSFFDRCINGTLTESDIEIGSAYHDPKEAKGNIRRKINSLPLIMGLFSDDTYVEEDFQKNRISCTFASANRFATLGFIATPKAVPRTLLKGNELDEERSYSLSLVLSKARSDKYYDTVVYGDLQYVRHFIKETRHLISPELLKKIK